jgi:histidinol-phosphate aminotransferase
VTRPIILDVNEKRPRPSDLAPSYVRAISPYVPGKSIPETARELGLDVADILKMASNESPLGASPRVKEAIERALADVHYYPDRFELVAALSAKLGVAPETLVVGNGSNDVLELAARAFLAPGDSAIYSQYGFLVYPLVVQAIGARGIEVPARGYATDLDAMAKAVRPDTKMVFVANPNNPTGTFVPWADVRRFIERLPRTVVAVLDEAYGEYLPDALRSPTASWFRELPNVVVARTLSKAYGLAGLRVGFGIASPDVADLMNRVRQPFNVNHLAMVAACAALEDEAFVEKCRAVNAAGLEELRAGLDRLGLEYIPPHGNFITLRVGDAGRTYQSLLREGVIVRPVANYGMPDHLRVTVGLPEHNARFLDALRRALGKA